MATTWTIAVKIGASAAGAPIHELTLEADTASDALRQAAGLVAAQEAAAAELLVDGQEEVFSRAEVETGLVEHQART
jgi:hypothetical protein